MVLDLSLAPWMIFPALLLAMAFAVAIMWTCDWIDERSDKLDNRK